MPGRSICRDGFQPACRDAAGPGLMAGRHRIACRAWGQPAAVIVLRRAAHARSATTATAAAVSAAATDQRDLPARHAAETTVRAAQSGRSRRRRALARPLGGGGRRAMLSAYLSEQGSMINGNALSLRSVPGWPPVQNHEDYEVVRAGRRQPAVGRQPSLQSCRPRSVIDSVGLPGVQFAPPTRRGRNGWR
jgi:hypothetical protein